MVGRKPRSQAREEEDFITKRRECDQRENAREKDGEFKRSGNGA